MEAAPGGSGSICLNKVGAALGWLNPNAKFYFYFYFFLSYYGIAPPMCKIEPWCFSHTVKGATLNCQFCLSLLATVVI